MTAKTAAHLVAEAKARIENLAPQAVAAERERHDALLVDVREPEERVQTGAIQGAIHAPRGMLEFYADPTSASHRPEFDPGRRVILYCASGGRSALAAAALQALGYARVAHLDGGLKAWRRLGSRSKPDRRGDHHDPSGIAAFIRWSAPPHPRLAPIANGAPATARRRVRNSAQTRRRRSHPPFGNCAVLPMRGGARAATVQRTRRTGVCRRRSRCGGAVPGPRRNGQPPTRAVAARTVRKSAMDAARFDDWVRDRRTRRGAVRLLSASSPRLA